MGAVDGKVAFISGVARGQGRSHAVRLAEEGADIIGFDVCENDPDVEYPLATQEDLDETVRQVEKTGQRIHAVKADVRDAAAVKKVLDDGVAEFGRLDIVLANAGIMPITGEQRNRQSAFATAVEVMLIGTANTIFPAIPHLQAHGEGGVILITSSTNGVVGGISEGNPGVTGYSAAKHGVVGVMRTLANTLAPQNIRVNTLHPTGVNSPMIANEAFGRYVTEHPDMAENLQNPLPVPNGLLDPSYVTDQVMHLVGESGRYITGQRIIFDGGFTNYR
ncbi:mycofactocin-coupled SDR family oxidoreductase [Actinomycetospora sp. TBRC 11914]|uniref:mycofactocin-coupled SDR family oxidoreductase n=1 Tax=Actinomycetospora sp. TBRC 11914 TaxID=2729387 RepID=UPI00145EC679|nr:mycofactocin-coupled SDR family oxidoreductase [Actinomycetospora sp. TBRC 11914]NMO91669.1 mycofactocin-coupled SDR family oxidoreductase [Actinomycetospora sp. TBRC 11914]